MEFAFLPYLTLVHFLPSPWLVFKSCKLKATMEANLVNIGIKVNSFFISRVTGEATGYTQGLTNRNVTLLDALQKKKSTLRGYYIGLMKIFCIQTRISDCFGSLRSVYLESFPGISCFFKETASWSTTFT